MESIMGNMVLGKDECLVALDDAGSGWVIAQSDHLREHDALTELSTEDNNFNSSWSNGLTVGVYKLTLRGWGHHDSTTGEFDAGFDVVSAEPLWACH